MKASNISKPFSKRGSNGTRHLKTRADRSLDANNNLNILMRNGFGCSTRSKDTEYSISNVRLALAPKLEALVPFLEGVDPALAAAIQVVHAELLEANKSSKARYDYNDKAKDVLCNILCTPSGLANIQSWVEHAKLKPDTKSPKISNREILLEEELAKTKQMLAEETHKRVLAEETLYHLGVEVMTKSKSGCNFQDLDDQDLDDLDEEFDKYGSPSVSE